MSTFSEALNQKLQNSAYADFGIENYDESRYGPLKLVEQSLSDKLKYAVKKNIGWKKNEIAKAYIKLFDKYIPKLEIMWQHFNEQDKQLLVEIIAYRLLGHKKVKLSFNNPQYWQAIEKAKTLKSTNETFDPHFMGQILEKFDLKPIGFDVNFFS